MEVISGAKTAAEFRDQLAYVLGLWTTGAVSQSSTATTKKAEAAAKERANAYEEVRAFIVSVQFEEGK